MNFFLNRYKKYGEEFDPKDIVVEQAIRINHLKYDPKEIVKRLDNKGIGLRKIPFLKHGYYSDSEFSMGATPEYLLGLYYTMYLSLQYHLTLT